MPEDATLKRIATALGRQMAAVKQMQDRSGPIYETARARSRISSEAWRAAGSPRPVHRVRRDGVPTYVFWSNHGDPMTWLPASDAEVAAWYAWWRERDRLRRDVRAAGQAGPGAP